MGPNLITFTDILSPSKSDIFGLKKKMSNYAPPQLEEWEGDLQNALHSQMSERIESSSRNVFFKFSFDFQIFYFLSFFLFFRKSSDDERSSGGEGRRLSKILSFFSRWEFSRIFLGKFTFWFWLILNSKIFSILLFMTYSHNLLNIKEKSKAN